MSKEYVAPPSSGIIDKDAQLRLDIALIDDQSKGFCVVNYALPSCRYCWPERPNVYSPTALYSALHNCLRAIHDVKEARQIHHWGSGHHDRRCALATFTALFAASHVQPILQSRGFRHMVV